MLAVACDVDVALARAAQRAGVGAPFAAVGEPRIDHAAQRQRRQETVGAELRRRDAFEHEHRLQQRAARRQAVVDREGRVAGFRAEQQVERAHHHRVVEAQEQDVLARQRGRPVEGRLPRLVEPRERFGAEHLRIEQQQLRALFLDVDPEMLEQAQDEVACAAVRVRRGQCLQQSLGARCEAGGELQQAVATFGDGGGEVGVRGAGLGHQRVEIGDCVGVAAGQRQGACDHALAVALEQFAAVLRAAGERAQALVEPAQQRMLRAAFEHAGVDVDVAALADAVEAADALLEQVRVQREVPQHEVLRELEVAALAADLGAQQQACAAGVGEVRCGAVALHDAEPLVKARHRDSGAQAQCFLQRVQLGLAAGDEQELLAGVRVEQSDQPRQAWIVEVGQRRGEGRRGDVAEELLDQSLAQGVVGRRRQQRDARHAAREAADHRAAVAEHDPPGTVPVHQLPQRGGARLGVAARRGRRRFRAEQAFQFRQVGVRRPLAGIEPRGQPRQREILRTFALECLQIVVARRIEQAQPREVSAAAELLRGGGEQQHARSTAGQRIHQLVLAARRFRRPGQMVRLVDYQQVPAGLQRGLRALAPAGEETQVGDHHLLVEEWIAPIAGRFDRLRALLVEDREVEIEATAQLDEPLINQRLGQQHQHAPGAPGGDQTRDHGAGFDRLAQAHLVGQQHARRPPLAGNLGHPQLVRDQVDARRQCAEAGVTARLGAALQRLQPKVERARAVDAAAEQAIIGLGDVLHVVQRALGNALAAAAVVQHAVAVLDFLDHEARAVGIDLVADAERGAQQRRAGHGVDAHGAGGGEQDLDLARIGAQHRAEPEFRLGGGQPALPGNEWRHRRLDGGRPAIIRDARPRRDGRQRERRGWTSG